MKWTPGPARCRSPECKAVILGMHENLYVGVAWAESSPEEWNTMLWDVNGHSNASSVYDLMPPTITREALARECLDEWYSHLGRDHSILEAALAVVAHVIEAVKSGRAE